MKALSGSLHIETAHLVCCQAERSSLYQQTRGGLARIVEPVPVGRAIFFQLSMCECQNEHRGFMRAGLIHGHEHSEKRFIALGILARCDEVCPGLLISRRGSPT